jgi:anti-sigma B factor antagonist
MELVITSTDVDSDQETLALKGSIDLVTRTALVAAGEAVLAAGHDLALDMSDVNFIDSTGIGAIVELHHIAKSRGAVLTIPQRSVRVQRILEVTGLADSWVA